MITPKKQNTRDMHRYLQVFLGISDYARNGNISRTHKKENVQTKCNEVARCEAGPQDVGALRGQTPGNRTGLGWGERAPGASCVMLFMTEQQTDRH